MEGYHKQRQSLRTMASPIDCQRRRASHTRTTSATSMCRAGQGYSTTGKPKTADEKDFRDPYDLHGWHVPLNELDRLREKTCPSSHSLDERHARSAPPGHAPHEGDPDLSQPAPRADVGAGAVYVYPFSNSRIKRASS